MCGSGRVFFVQYVLRCVAATRSDSLLLFGGLEHEVNALDGVAADASCSIEQHMLEAAPCTTVLLPCCIVILRRVVLLYVFWRSELNFPARIYASFRNSRAALLHG